MGELPDQKMLMMIGIAVLSGGGAATVIPHAMPDLYRPDPATGAELRELHAEIEEIREYVRDFLITGPTQVRENQERQLRKLDEILDHLRQLPQAQR